MKSTYAVRRGPSPVMVFTYIVIAIVLGFGATIGTLYALGVDIPFLPPHAVPKVAAKRSGVPVPVLSRPMTAYSTITLDSFFDLKTGEPQFFYSASKEEAAENGFITDPRELVGRVLARDKRAGFPFTARDLFPRGTRPGLVAGVPAGKRAFVLLAEKIQGIYGLKAGDRFDLLASLPVDMDKAMSKLKSPNQTDLLIGGIGQSPKRANVKPLVQNGAVVIPVVMREIPTGTTPNAKTGKLPSKPVEEITIAVEPDEVAPLSEALAVSASIVCVARSGQPDDPGPSSMTPGSNPGPKLHTMETIVGNKRQTLVFPGTGQAPQLAQESGNEETLPAPPANTHASTPAEKK
jgi:Flp pilus assembly protein CpaB